MYIGRYYGLAILSKYPSKTYEEFRIPNPRFEVTRPNGNYWIMDDKFVQFTQLQIDSSLLNVFNLHYYPSHIFNVKINDSRMKKSNNALSKYILSKDLQIPTIVAGDFNNKDIELSEIFPDLFTNSSLKQAIVAETTTVDNKGQLDNILYTNNSLRLVEVFVEKNLSDHYSVFTSIKLK